MIKNMESVAYEYEENDVKELKMAQKNIFSKGQIWYKNEVRTNEVGWQDRPIIQEEEEEVHDLSGYMQRKIKEWACHTIPTKKRKQKNPLYYKV